MTKHRQHDADDYLVAENDDPHLSVHALSEFVYCPQAGLCLYEQDGQFDEPQEDASLFFLPMHEPQELGLLLESLMRQFQRVLFGGLGTFVLVLFAACWFGGIALWLATAATLALTAWGLYDRGYWAYMANQQLQMWQDARPQMPDPDLPKIQDVDWRDLIASGATIIAPPAANSNPAWKLGGKPWRILEYGDLRIPVFLHRTPWSGLFPQHFVRMVAYCRLLETEGGFRSPYGVIVKGQEDFAAVTIPNAPRTRAMFQTAVPAARRTVRDSEEINRNPPRPDNENLCEGCHRSRRVRLRRWRRFLRHGMPIEPRPENGRRGAKYHSHCGDRFGWFPPTDRAKR